MGAIINEEEAGVMSVDELMKEAQSLDILYCDEWLVAVNKPAGLLVHRTSAADEGQTFVLQLLRSQLGRHLYPLHRLDRPTSGVLLFAFSSAMASALQRLWQEQLVRKEYYAFVRGWMVEPLLLNYPVKTEKGKLVQACTMFEPIRQVEYAVATDRYPTARYSLVRCLPRTGRWHQLRQHLAHLRHYIINDRVHGDGKQNRIMTEFLHTPMLFLHARSLTFVHPHTGGQVAIVAPFPEWWDGVLEGVDVGESEEHGLGKVECG